MFSNILKVLFIVACFSFSMSCGSKSKESAPEIKKTIANIVDTTKKVDSIIKIDSTVAVKPAPKKTTTVKTVPAKPKINIEVKTPIGNAKIEK